MESLYLKFRRRGLWKWHMICYLVEVRSVPLTASWICGSRIRARTFILKMQERIFKNAGP